MQSLAQLEPDPPVTEGEKGKNERNFETLFGIAEDSFDAYDEKI
jgi:hypothetical protein